MNRDETRARGAALRAFMKSKLPVPSARSITGLARKAGLRPNTVSSWWSKGFVPDNASLELLADALGLELADLVGAYGTPGGRTRQFTDPELEALIDRVTEVAVRRVLAEQKAVQDE
jgi:transcriptional regulator with XRE-family HTH domain